MPTSLLTDEQRATVDGLDRILTWARRIKPVQGISASTFTTLDTLAFAGPMRISELADREGITQPGMTGLINRLEGEGLARRASDPTDGRASLVSVTEAGLKVLADRRSGRSELLATRIGQLTAADQAALFAALPAIANLTSDLPT
ncbi:DNA-binding MarR family transcriptional regulator [Nakamurella sp. UYEF19]|uniref:MarR family winged helix-turn-helix transcriptional regulator n=1 Tax=Nakamurella sp. UYEF19 TaxID=1756392 RepID=UPI0033911ED9